MSGCCWSFVASADVMKLAFCEDLATFFQIIFIFFRRVNALGGVG
jgi:hypothetical protein